MKITKYGPRALLRWPMGWDLLDDDRWGQIDESDGLSVYETDDQVIVEAKVPGVSEEEIDIDYQDRNLVIRASHQESEEEKKGKKVVYRSFSESNYAYSAQIPCPIDPKRIKAGLSKGILTVKLDKAEEAKPTKIKVEKK
jgi:HSP20 family protein